MFFGGFLLFGNGITKTGTIVQLVFGIMNAFVGAICVYFGFARDTLGLKIFGFIWLGLGLAMAILGVIGLIRRNNRQKEQTVLE